MVGAAETRQVRFELLNALLARSLVFIEHHRSAPAELQLPPSSRNRKTDTVYLRHRRASSQCSAVNGPVFSSNDVLRGLGSQRQAAIDRKLVKPSSEEVT